MRYRVDVPMAGYISVIVEADSEDAAIDKAFDSGELTLENIVEWDTHREIVEGNVFHGNRNKVEATEEPIG